jgi:hypothetical protein
MKAKAKRKPPPLLRYWKVAIRRITGLHYCDRDCGCGEANGLWWWPTPRFEGRPPWLPGWTNGADTASIWRWLAENGHADLAPSRLPAAPGRRESGEEGG